MKFGNTHVDSGDFCVAQVYFNTVPAHKDFVEDFVLELILFYFV